MSTFLIQRSRLAAAPLSFLKKHHLRQHPVIVSSPSLLSWSTVSLFSTTSSSSSPSSDNDNEFQERRNALSRYGVGGHQWTKWAQSPAAYQQLLHASLRNGVSLLEVVDPEGGELAMANAFRQVVQDHPDLLSLKGNHQQQQPLLTLTTRIGYRTMPTSSSNDTDESPTTTSNGNATNGTSNNGHDDNNNNNNKSSMHYKIYDGDVVVEEGRHNPKTLNNGDDRVVHNLSQQYIQQTLESIPPLLQLQHDFPDHIRVLYLIHNPEVQILELLQQRQGDDKPQELPSLQIRQEYIQDHCAQAMKGLEWGVSEGFIHSYGVVSNGLGLPNHHALHLAPQTLLNLSSTSTSTSFQHFTTVQLPLNLLETRGQKVAQTLHTAAADKKSSTITDIHAIRPLMSYPDLGTGTALPLELVDYAVSQDSIYPSAAAAAAAAEEKMKKNDESSSEHHQQHDLVYTNNWPGPPSMYQVALQTALSHFDADSILELQAAGKKLSTEERETLEGCKLFQSMLHDLDIGLEHVTSFAAHEQELYERIIPLIYDSFEELDDTTAQVLQAFFVAYGMAVRYQIATKTRELVVSKTTTTTNAKDEEEEEEENKNKGDETKEASSTQQKSSTTYDIPPTMTLQEYALRYVLKEPAISRVIVGASSMDELVEHLRLIQTIHYDKEEGGK